MVSILILFHSQEYGNTKAMAEAIAKGVQSVDGKADLINTNETRLDIYDYRKYDAVAFGSPDYYSYIAGGLKTFVDDLYIERKTNREGLENKPYALFFSHGGGGRVKESFEKLFKAMRVGTKIGETIESFGFPNEKVLEACFELGIELFKSIDK